MFRFGGPNIRKMTEEHDVDGLVELLTHRNPQTRLEAAEALAGLNEGRGWRYLMAPRWLHCRFLRVGRRVNCL